MSTFSAYLRAGLGNPKRVQLAARNPESQAWPWRFRGGEAQHAPVPSGFCAH